jgi:hypothetical protein
MNDASRVQQHSAGFFFGPDATAPRAQSRSVFYVKPKLKLIIFWVEVYFHFGYIKGVPAPLIKADAR